MDVVKLSGGPEQPQAAGGSSTDPTRTRILALLLASGGLSAPELAERLGLTATGVRRHLGNLAVAGLVESRRQTGPRGRGRPAQIYYLTPLGRQGFGEQYHDLALSALAELVAAAGPEALARLAEKRLSAVEEDYRLRRAANPTGDPVAQLAEALSAAGYFASGHTDGELCLHHCPVAHVAAHFPELCEAEAAIFARLLGTEVSQSASIALGDAICRAQLGNSPATSAHTAIQLPDPVPHSADRKVSA